MSRQPLPDASCLQLTGNLDCRFRLALRRLTQGPEYTLEFILSDVSGAYWRAFTEYCGDISGRYLGAVGLGRTYTREPDTLADEVARGIARAQCADGHCGPHRPGDTLDFALIYGHGRLLKGLVEYHAVTPGAETRETIRRLADYFCAVAPRYQMPEAVAQLEFIYYTQALEGLVGAWRLLGDERYLASARAMADLLWEEPRGHSHSYLSTLLGVLALYQATGEERYLRQARALRDRAAPLMTVDGGVPETFPDRPITEFCSVGDWLMLHLGLWRANGETALLEEAEHILLNAVFFNQFCNGGFGSWNFHPAHGYRGRVEVGSWEAYWCCCLHGVRALYEAITYAYTWGEGEVRANLFFPGTLRPPHLPRVTVRQETPYPLEGKVRLTVCAPAGERFTLRLRVPSWARGARLSVNGKQVPLHLEEGYAAVERRWGSTDVVELAFDTSLHLEDRQGPIGRERLRPGVDLEGVSLRWGPVLLGIDEMYNATGPGDEKESWTAPSCLLLPPSADGSLHLPRGRALPVPQEWPGLQFEAPAEMDNRVILTPLARVPAHQPHCAPSVRTRYQVRLASSGG